MKIVSITPALYNYSRFTGKLMQSLDDKIAILIIKKIKMIVVHNFNFDIDTTGDLDRAQAHLNQLNSQ